MAVFARQLSNAAGREAIVAEDGLRLLPDRIVIAPGDAHLTIDVSRGYLVARLARNRSSSGCLPSVDPMLSSVADAYGEAGIGVMLSGMGRDGLIGSHRLIEQGGAMLAQDPHTSAIWGMPRAVAEAGLASAVLPPRELARRLTRSHDELVDSTVTAVIQAFLDSAAADSSARGAALPSWTTNIAGSKFGLDSKYLYIAGLKIPAAILALLPLPSGSNESRAFDRSGQMYQDLRQAAQRSATLDEFKDAIRDIRERKEREREFEKNRRTAPPPAETPDQ
jgi:hypothetical protein